MKFRKCQKLEIMQLYLSAIIVNTKYKFLVNANESNHHEWKKCIQILSIVTIAL